MISDVTRNSMLTPAPRSSVLATPCRLVPRRQGSVDGSLRKLRSRRPHYARSAVVPGAAAVPLSATAQPVPHTGQEPLQRRRSGEVQPGRLGFERVHQLVVDGGAAVDRLA